MAFNLLQAPTRQVRIAADKELPDIKERQRTIPSLQSLSRLTSTWNVCFLECLQGVILRNGIRHIEAARVHMDLAHKREKQADRIGVRAAAALAGAGQMTMKHSEPASRPNK